MQTAKECMYCEHCDLNRINDIDQVRCKRFSTYVNLFDSCDYFLSKYDVKLFKELNNEQV